jgi:propanol-preferring alcohol dehydrogenase
MSNPSTQIAAVVPASGASSTGQVDVIDTYPRPVPKEGDLLIKLEYSGVCYSDVHSVRGETPMLTDVAGHEGVGRVIGGRFWGWMDPDLKMGVDRPFY